MHKDTSAFLKTTKGNTIRLRLLKMAEQKYKKIRPIPAKGSFDNSFTIFNDNLIFWFNTEDDSTHVVQLEI